MKKLILTADDFGPIEQINNGVKKAIEQGKLKSVAAIVNFDSCAEVAQEFKQLFETYQVEVGLHFTLNSGKPCASNGVDSLTDNNGHFHIFDECEIDEFLPSEVAIELEAQYQRFIDCFGYVPKHISNHFGVLDLFPDLHLEYLKFCVSKNLSKRSEKIIPGFQRSAYFTNLKNKLRRELPGLQNFIGLYKDPQVIDYFRNKYKSVKSPDHIDGRYYLLSKKVSINQALKDVKEGGINELMLHLYDEDAAIINSHPYKGINTGYFDGRKKESATLRKSKFLQFINNNIGQYKIGNWEDLY